MAPQLLPLLSLFLDHTREYLSLQHPSKSAHLKMLVSNYLSLEKSLSPPFIHSYYASLGRVMQLIFQEMERDYGRFQNNQIEEEEEEDVFMLQENNQQKRLALFVKHQGVFQGLDCLLLDS